MPRQTLNMWLAAARPNIRGHNLVKLARGLKKERAEVEARLREAWADNPDPDATGAEPLEWEDLAAFRRVPIVNFTTNYDKLLQEALAGYYREGSVVAPVAELPAFAVVADRKDYYAGDKEFVRPGALELLVFADTDPKAGALKPGRPHALLLEGQPDAEIQVTWLRSDPKDPTRVLAGPLSPDPAKVKVKQRIPREKIRRLGRWLATFPVS